MRIAEIVATFPPRHGGMGYVCYHNSLELARRGHEVTVFTLDHGASGTDPREFRVVRLRTPLLSGDGGVVPQLFRHLKGFDAVHLHYPFYGGGEYVALASRVRGTGYLVTYHMDVYGNTLFRRAAIAAYEPVAGRWILRGALRIGAVSLPHLRSTRVAKLLDWNRVVEVPNGVDTERFRPGGKDPALVALYGLEGKMVVLFVGNLQPFKRLDLLIDAVAGIGDPTVVLLVVGGGYGEPEYRAQSRRLGVEDRVIFAGPKSPGADLPDHYRLGDMLVLPSTHSESFGLVVLEAMASGIPAVVSSLPGPSSLIEDGEDGLVASAGDVEDLKRKMLLLIGDAGDRKRMGGRAREKALKRYGWNHAGDILEKELTDIASGRHRG
ncbi:MAG: glycosyltransferase family 4 protein [Candidatus Deferrimicrobium sp.]